MGGDQNTVHLITESQETAWPTMDKTAVAAKLAGLIAENLSETGRGR
jgi:phosphopantothenoylcysteine synthetase/decarboxylase